MADPVAKKAPASGGKRRAPGSKCRIILVTGTDTGIGKTVVTSLLLAHLRSEGVRALALKPFCSGSRSDARILYKIQGAELSIDEVNPWFFPEPLAPLAAVRRASGCPRLREVVSHVRAISSRCETLLIEGAGGLFVPLGRGYTVANLIAELRCQVIVVAANRLGCINHTLLTIAALRAMRCRGIKVVISSQRKPDLSAATNEQIIADFIRPLPVFSLPYLGRDLRQLEALEDILKISQKSLAPLVG